jgi:hypothetical protein
VVSRQTIRNCLNRAGYNGRVARKVPLLSPKNIKRRFELTKSWANWTLKKWDTALFTDEVKISLIGSDGSAIVCRKKGLALESKNCIPTVKHGGGNIMIWGSFSSKGVGSLAFIDTKMTACGYRRILCENLEKSRSLTGLTGEFIFQQDNDPKHTSREVRSFFE